MITDKDVVKKWCSIEESAKKRRIDFNLSLRHTKKLLLTKRCYFTGETLNEDNRSVDRLESNIGYTDKNTVACIRSLNQRKGNLTPKEIEMLYKGLKKKGIL